MSRRTSPSTERRYPLATICRFWACRGHPSIASACGKRRTTRARPGAAALRVSPATLAPHRPATRAAHPHDGTVATERVDQVWGTDMTETFSTSEGRAYVFVAVDHCSGEFTGIHAASGASRWEALEPIRQGVSRHFAR
ncbi:hypothetical protein [Cereibacter azotoformans]|uniref:hypothetical protein n=1 Tax=Cereibacter azotoformans TaxID=43057 RepID=UPI000C6D0CA1|nr:hypothetical protein [Cereibacter azotoformans]